jgi:hypothetical protein
MTKSGRGEAGQEESRELRIIPSSEETKAAFPNNGFVPAQFTYSRYIFISE